MRSRLASRPIRRRLRLRCRSGTRRTGWKTFAPTCKRSIRRSESDNALCRGTRRPTIRQAMPRVAKTPDWTIFETFVRPVQIPSWDVPLRLSDSVKGALAKQQSVFAAERRRWDSLLGELGGDPNARDWSSFRMLRRDREEDWSDWLAQLLEESHDGRFARALFSDVDGQRPLDYSVRALHREVPEDGVRSDIVIEWRSGDYTHVEVKVGDPDLDKTLETARAMEKRFGQRC